MKRTLLGACVIFALSGAVADETRVDHDALFMLATWWELPQNETNWSVDYDGSARIDTGDLLLLLEHWHDAPQLTTTPTPSPTATATPSRETMEVDLPGLPAGARPLRLVRIPAGSFAMGSLQEADWAFGYPSERPPHAVEIGSDFWLGVCEITQAQWVAVMGSNPVVESGYTRFGVGDDQPVYHVSWNDCRAFVAALSASASGTFRLPSEAEWEYACRGGGNTPFSFGVSTCSPGTSDPCELLDYGWWAGNNGVPGAANYGSKPVGLRLPNAYGLFDMHGNVWEWCEDDWHGNYTAAPGDGSAWSGSPRGERRVIRGGAWGLSARFCRATTRYGFAPDFDYDAIGLRVVME